MAMQRKGDTVFLQTSLFITIACVDLSHVTLACEMVADMVESLQSVLALGHKRNSTLPLFLTAVLKNIVISLARLPLVNSYTRVPPLVSWILLNLICNQAANLGFSSLPPKARITCPACHIVFIIVTLPVIVPAFSYGCDTVLSPRHSV